MDELQLTQDEINTLLQGISGATEEAFNLATQARAVRGHMPTLNLIYERFIQFLRIDLFELLGRTPEITISPVRHIRYTDLLHDLEVLANVNLIKIKPLSGTAMIIMDANLVFLLVDKLFGGNGKLQTRIEAREFSAIEQRIIQKTLNIIFDALVKAWELIYSVYFEYVRSEMNPQFANIASPNEIVVTASFRIDIGTMGGDFHICLPYSMLEPIINLLCHGLQKESITDKQSWAHLIKHQIKDTKVEAIAELCTIESNLRQILNIKVGDIIPFEMPDNIAVNVDSLPILNCKYGKINGQYAVQVEQIINHSTN